MATPLRASFQIVMSATDTATESDTETAPVPGPKRLQPHQIGIAIGLALAFAVIGLGIFGSITAWHGDSPVERVVFGNIPGWFQAVFYPLLAVSFAYGAIVFSYRMRNWERGGPDRRDTTPKNAKRRLEDLRAGVYMQTLLRDPAAGIMHSLIYFGFLILLAVTTTSEINHQLPTEAKFLHGGVYQAFAFVGDLGGVMFLVGVIWAIVRRYVQRPYRIRIKSKPEHAVILGTLFVIGVTGFLTEMWRIALDGRPDLREVVVHRLPAVLAGPRRRRRSRGPTRSWWVVHVVSFVAFLVILPVTMLRHIFTSPLNMYLRDRDRPKGAMKPMPNLMETELESFGASTVEDFTWKQLLDTDACTMCGRCTSVCPAHATGKPLDPREIVLKTGEVMAAHRRPQGLAAHRRRPRHHRVRQLAVRAHHRRRGLGLHDLQGVRRDLPGQHRDPRQDPRHAALPVAHGVELPDRARHTPTGRWRTRATRGA